MEWAEWFEAEGSCSTWNAGLPACFELIPPKLSHRVTEAYSTVLFYALQSGDVRDFVVLSDLFQLRDACAGIVGGAVLKGADFSKKIDVVVSVQTNEINVFPGIDEDCTGHKRCGLITERIRFLFECIDAFDISVYVAG